MLDDNGNNIKRAKARPKSRKKQIRWTEELFEEKVMKPLSEGGTINDIARDLGITRQSVTLRMKNYGINNKAEAIQELLKRARQNSSI